MNISHVGKGKVVLIAGGGKTYTDVAARFCRSEKDLDSILASQEDSNLVRTIINSGHNAGLEFDYFIFGVEGYSRVTEVQLVRKRLASYLIKSGRVDKNGKRGFDIVLPEDVSTFTADVLVPAKNVYVGANLLNYNTAHGNNAEFLHMEVSAEDLLNWTETWYNKGVELQYREEDLRYLKPQATEFKAIIGMNAHALRDWFKIRCCNRAQTEIRDLANKMLRLCREASPTLFEGAGASCVSLGYCPEMEQCSQKKGSIPTHADVLKLIKDSQHIKAENMHHCEVVGTLTTMKALLRRLHSASIEAVPSFFNPAERNLIVECTPDVVQTHIPEGETVYIISKDSRGVPTVFCCVGSQCVHKLMMTSKWHLNNYPESYEKDFANSIIDHSGRWNRKVYSEVIIRLLRV